MLSFDQIKELLLNISVYVRPNVQMNYNTAQRLKSISTNNSDSKPEVIELLTDFVIVFLQNNIIEQPSTDDEYEGEQSVIFEYENVLYKIEYYMNSYSGKSFENAEVYVVHRHVETIVTYKREACKYDMSNGSMHYFYDKVIELKEIDAPYDNTEYLLITKSGVSVKEQSVTKVGNNTKLQVGGYLVNVNNEWLYFDPKHEDFITF